MANTTASAPSKSSVIVIIVLIILVLGGLFFTSKLFSQNEELRKANSELEAKANSSDSILNKISEEQKIINDSNTTVVNLVGTKVPKSAANVYWDSTRASVYLVVKNMPQLDVTQAQYQLWALIDGKPFDLGVFDAKNDKVLLKMKGTKKADAFAITIEKKGGATSPTLEKMQSIGKTKGL